MAANSVLSSTITCFRKRFKQKNNPSAFYPHIYSAFYPHIRSAFYPHIRSAFYPHIRPAFYPHIRSAFYPHIRSASVSAFYPYPASTIRVFLLLLGETVDNLIFDWGFCSLLVKFCWLCTASFRVWAI